MVDDGSQPEPRARRGDRTARPLSSDVYDQLRRRLLVGDYPLVERLTEMGLAEQLGASRTPVREALLRLESEGLVERRHQGGFFPRSPNLAGIRDLYELRRILELASLARPERHGESHDTEALRSIRDDWLGMVEDPPDPDPGFVLIDESFHLGVAEAAGNTAITEHLRAVNDRIRVVRMQNFVHRQRIAVTIEQHLAILDALIEGRPQLAGTLMEAHLDEALSQASERAAQAIERMMTAGMLVTRPPG
jgi:DNA-binding GntR family transcriptional regulator